MKYFVHIKDDVVFAWHQSSTEVDIPGDNIFEVASADDSVLNKKFINGEFINAPLIKYAVLDEDNDNTVIGIEKTYFSSDVKGPVITDNAVKVLWKWNGTEFVSPDTVSAAPITVEPIPTVVFNDIEVTTSEALPAVDPASVEIIAPAPSAPEANN